MRARAEGQEWGRDWSGIDKGSVGMRMGQKERARGGSRHPKDVLKRVNAAEKSIA